MPINQMRWRIELLGATRSDDGAGGFTRSDTVEAEVWAEIRPASPREVSAAARLEVRLTHIITIRTGDVTPTQGMRVRWDDRRGTTRTAYVEAVADKEEAGRFWELQCREGGPL